MPNPPALFDKGRIFTVLQYLAAQIAQSLENAGQGTFDRVEVTTGTIADDDCTCGLVAITVGSMYRTNAFPRNDSGVSTNCQTPGIAVDCTLRVLRCVPNPTDNARVPTAAELTASAVEVLDDAFVVWETLDCALVTMRKVNPPQLIDGIVGTQTFIAHEGGCGGSETAFTIGFLSNTCGC